MRAMATQTNDIQGIETVVIGGPHHGTKVMVKPGVNVLALPGVMNGPPDVYAEDEICDISLGFTTERYRRVFVDLHWPHVVWHYTAFLHESIETEGFHELIHLGDMHVTRHVRKPSLIESLVPDASKVPLLAN